MLRDGLAQLRRDVEEVATGMRTEATALELKRDQASGAVAKAEQLTDEAAILSAQLDTFSQTYLQRV